MKKLLTISILLIPELIFSGMPEQKNELSSLIVDLTRQEKQIILDQKNYNKVIEFIKGHEGYRAYPYVCPGGFWTVGYGCIIKYSGKLNFPLSEQQATKLLKQRFDQCINLAKKHFEFDTYNKYLAVSHLIYAVGIGRVLREQLIKDNILDVQKLKSLKYSKNREFEIQLFYDK